MKFINTENYQHGGCAKVGVLISNLGTPEQPTKAALKKYLKQFLSDPRLVEPSFPRWVWLLILNVIILNVRPAKSAKAYESIWGEFGEGSPLLDICNQITSKLQTELAGDMGSEVVVELGMRYGEPSIPKALRNLKQKGVTKLLVLPLYPQYSASTTASTFDEVTAELQKWRWVPEFKFLPSYHSHSQYIQALANSIEAHQKAHGKPDLLVFSYHGIPKRYHKNGDPYFCQCHATTRYVAERLQLQKDSYMTTFQSIFGREEWLKPYTAETLKSLPSQGIKNIQVICPGFSADCLETIEEIEEENKEYFLHAGGESFSYIPALNDSSDHIKTLVSILSEHFSVSADDLAKPPEDRKRALENYQEIQASQQLQGSKNEEV